MTQNLAIGIVLTFVAATLAGCAASPTPKFGDDAGSVTVDMKAVKFSPPT